MVKPLFMEIEIENDFVLNLGSGVLLPKVAKIAYENSLTGLEFAGGIPGSIGGAIRMNAGAYGGEMKDIVISSVCMDKETMETYEISNEEHEFEYRYSRFNNNKEVIISVKLQLRKGEKDKIAEMMQENIRRRKETQPIDFPSAGSAFKKNKNFITAKIVDECGLKGYNIGDAAISEKHAGFIINRGAARARDVLELVECVKKAIYERYKENIELEIEVLGED